MRTPDFLPIEFLVIGGSIAGLSAAIALTRVGHQVTVIDWNDPFKPTDYDAGIRLPPNSTKVYYRWGMEQRLRKTAIKSQGTMFAAYDSGSVVGSHEWEDGVLEETGGDFLHCHHGTLRRILAESAKEHGARFLTARVESVKPDHEKPTVTLESGETLAADVLIGADGLMLDGFRCRPAVMEAIEQEDTHVPTGLQFFNAIVPESAMTRPQDKKLMAELRSHGKVFMWIGPDYGAMAYPIKVPDEGEEDVFTLLVYVPRRDAASGAFRVPNEDLVKALKNADPRLKELAIHASRITCVPMVERPSLEEWVHPDGRLLCIGEAAHPMSSNSTYSTGMATGDAAVLGRVFAHLHSREQINSFLSAVQEIRQGRVEQVATAAAGNVLAVALPPGVAAARGADARAQAERGLQRLSGCGARGPAEEMREMVESVFAYDPEDEADGWWVEWGVMQERMGRWNLSSTLAVHVEEAQKEDSE